jgi:hypothetical protein
VALDRKGGTVENLIFDEPPAAGSIYTGIEPGQSLGTTPSNPVPEPPKRTTWLDNLEGMTGPSPYLPAALVAGVAFLAIYLGDER